MRTFFGAVLLIVAAASFAQSPMSEAQSAARAALFGSPAFTQIGILETTAREYSVAGNHAAALPLREKSLALLEEALGKDDIAITPMLLNLARNLAFLGQFDRTLILHTRALAIREKVLGPEHLDTAEALNDLGMSYWALGQHEKALPLQIRTLAIYEKSPGQEGMAASARKYLAATYSALAQYDKVLPLQLQLLSFMEKVYGIEHRSTGEALNDLAITYLALDQPGQALPLSQRALEISQNVLGGNHPDTASNFDTLSRIYKASGFYDEALKVQQRALDIKENGLGPEHRDTLLSLNNLALIYRDLALYDMAIPLQQRVILLTEKNLGLNHPSVPVSLSNIAITYQSLGQFDKALPMLSRALEIEEKVLRVDHPDTAKTMINLAAIYRELNQPEKALSLNLRATNIFEGLFGVDHSSVATSIHGLAITYGQLGQYDKAETLLLQAFSIRVKVLGFHKDTGDSLVALASFYSLMSQPEKGLPLTVRALEIYKKLLGADNLDTGVTYLQIGETYRQIKNYDLAMDQSLRGLAIAEKYLGNTHPVIARGLMNLSAISSQTGRPNLAIGFLKMAVNIYQAQREQVSRIGLSELRGYTDLVVPAYTILAALLTDQGRLSEANQVLDMLKEDEQFDFIRRAATADPRKTKISYTGTEKVWLDRYRQIADRLGALGREEQALQKQAKLGLTPEQQQRQKALAADLQVAQAAFMAFVGEMRDSFAQQGPARKVEVEEVSAQALRDTQGLLKGLGDDTALLQYYITENRVGMLLTTPGVQLARSSSIDLKELNRKIGELRRLLQDPKSNPLPVAQALYQILVAPIAKDLEDAGVKTVMLSLDGALRYLPFSALHDGKQYLLQRWNLPLYTSVTKNKLRDVVAPQWQAAGLGVTREWPEFKPLAGVKAEMGGIVKTAAGGVMPGEVYLDEAFTALRLKDVSQRKFPLLHVASHFRFSPGTEVNSFLLLGDGERLTLGDIRTQNYRFDNVDLLTLSACDTGLGGGRDEQGREIEGFGVIAQQQGAKAVLATLWPVADQSTAILMSDLYRRRQAMNLTKIEALKQAQVALQVQPKYAHPYYWAPFILMGNWK